MEPAYGQGANATAVEKHLLKDYRENYGDLMESARYAVYIALAMAPLRLPLLVLDHICYFVSPVECFAPERIRIIGSIVKIYYRRHAMNCF